MDKKVIYIGGVVLVVLLFSYLGVSVFSSGSKTQRINGGELREVDVRLKWLHQTQFAGNYVAEEKGFYEELGLNVSLHEGGIEFPAIEDVSSGKSDFGIAAADELMVAVSEGESLKAIAVIYKLSPFCYFSLKDSGITKPHDFVGKSVGITHNTGASYAYVTMLSNLGIDREKINEVDIEYDLGPFYRGEIDVWTGFRTNEPKVAQDAGYEINLIYPEDWGVKIYADVLFTTTEKIENEPELVEDFLRATLEGWQYAIENEEEAVDITMEYVEGSSRSHQSYMLKQSIPLIHSGEGSLGWMESKEWEGVQRILFENQILKKPEGPENVYTMEFLNRIYGMEEKEKIAVKLLWLHQNQFAGLYAADQRGYYDVLGQDVELRSAGYGVAVEDAVSSGENYFGITIPGNFLKKVSEGHELKAIAALYSKDPTVYISLKEKNIEILEDFEGKTVAGIPPQETILKIMMNKNDVDYSAVEFVPKKYGVQSLVDPDVDILAGVAINELQEAIDKGYDINVIYSSDYGFDSYYNLLFTTEELVDSRPDFVRDFLSATLEGWEYVYDNPGVSENYVFEYDTGLNPLHQEKMLESSLEFIKGDSSENAGMMSDYKWEQLYDDLNAVGEIENQFDIKDAYTLKFLEEIYS